MTRVACWLHSPAELRVVVVVESSHSHTLTICGPNNSVLHTLTAKGLVAARVPLHTIPAYVCMRDETRSVLVPLLTEEPSQAEGLFASVSSPLLGLSMDDVREAAHTVGDGYTTAMGAVIGQLAALMSAL